MEDEIFDIVTDLLRDDINKDTAIDQLLNLKLDELSNLLNKWNLRIDSYDKLSKSKEKILESGELNGKKLAILECYVELKKIIDKYEND